MLVGDWHHPDCLGNHWLLVWVAERLSSGQSLVHNDSYYWPVGDAPWIAGNGSEGLLYLPFHLLWGWPVGVAAYAGAVWVGNGLAGWALGRAAGAAWFSCGGGAYAAAPTEKRFVFVILRGAMDGLTAVPPLGDPNYLAARGAIAMAGDGGQCLPLNNLFALHPALPTLHALYHKQQATIIHAVASPYRERSHFDAQDVLENGMAQAHAAQNGWLGRALAAR